MKKKACHRILLTALILLGASMGTGTSVQAAAKLSDLVDASKTNSALPDPTRFGVRMEVGDISSAKKWLAAGLDPNYEAPTIGTGLMIAAWEGNLELLKLFVEAGADINFENKSGETALMMAAWKNQDQAVRYLLEKGAQINRGEVNDKKANPQLSTFEQAESKKIPLKWSAFHYAVFAGHEKLAKYLLEQGADINALSTNGGTPLMMALYEGKVELAQWLLDIGARTDITNDRGHDAFVWAMRYGHKELARRIGGAEKFAKAITEPKETWGMERKGTYLPVEVAKVQTELRHAKVNGNEQQAQQMEKRLDQLLIELAAQRPIEDAKRASARNLDDQMWRKKVAMEAALPIAQGARVQIQASKNNAKQQSAQVLFEYKSGSDPFKQK